MSCLSGAKDTCRAFAVAACSARVVCTRLPSLIILQKAQLFSPSHLESHHTVFCTLTPIAAGGTWSSCACLNMSSQLGCCLRQLVCIFQDCCTAVANGQKGWQKAQQHFDEPSHNCLSNNLVGGNSVNDGDVGKCCASRGTSSRSAGPGNQKYPAGGFYNHIIPKNSCNLNGV